MLEKNFVTAVDANRNKQITVDISTAKKEKGGIFLNVIGTEINDDRENETKKIRLCHLNNVDNNTRKRIIKAANSAGKITKNGKKDHSNKGNHRQMHS